MSEVLLRLAYGQLPPAPSCTSAAPLHGSRAQRFLNAQHEQFRLTTESEHRISFLLHVLIPDGGGPWPVVLTGDGCWRHLSDEITLQVLRRGYVVAEFNRVEIFADHAAANASQLTRPDVEGAYGALAAWAWGYHRCVDFLRTCAFVDPRRIAVVGHSRGGKAALLAGATDERIALVAANSSGCTGAGCFRRQGPSSETLADIVRRFAYWFSPQLQQFVGKEHQLPFDQHYLKALIAPRPLLTTEALGDLWANPTGTWQTHAAAREVYRFLGVPDRIGICYREGGHGHSFDDWSAFLDFADWHLRGSLPTRRFDTNPFPDKSPAFSWSAP